MKINPINTINNSTDFKAKIEPTESLKNAFDMVERSANSSIMKDLNFAKDFLDSIARISESQKVADYKIEIDKRRANHIYTKINGRSVSGGDNDRMPNVQDSYLVIEGTKNFASHLEEIEPSILDLLKAKVEIAQRALDEIKERYSERLKAEFEQAKQIIFTDGH